jgi:periplasmic protein TonB
MLAYAAQTRPAGRAGSPQALTLILGGHALAIAAVMTAKMDLVDPFTPEPPPIVFNVPEVKAPPPEPQPEPQTDPQQSFIERPIPLIDMERIVPTVPLGPGPTIEDIGAVIGAGPTAVPLDPPTPSPVRIAARFATPDSALKPPYPLDKRRAEEEASLRLKRSIDARGRVVAVEPVGPADPSFLEAARRHILRAWRYKPATEDGVAVPSSTVISLSFRLEDV